MKRVKAQQEELLPLALYRKPGEEYVWAVFQNDAQLLDDASITQPGFHVVPFNNSETKTIRIRPDRVYRSQFRKTFPPAEASALPEDQTAMELFTGMVSRAVSQIQNKRLEKVVLSRRFSTPFQGSLKKFFTNLLQSYPNAYCYLWYHPEVGVWAGASPELLLSYDGQMARTDSLAGTLPVQEATRPVWTEKETHEQAVVTDYIADCIRKVGGEPIREQTETIKAGTLWHIRTPVRSELGAEAADQLLSALHPTPAVCGYPLEVAREQIAHLENYNREYYTGFLGDSGLEKEDTFQFFVNLRCLQFRGSEAYVYVGCGITGESDPQKEWEETRQKSRTMLAVLENSGKTMG